MRDCTLCSQAARMYCESDRASLCWDCDAKVHGANFLVARHSRCLLCRSCQSPTPWNASGARLRPTVSLCDRCTGGGCDEKAASSLGDSMDAAEEGDDEGEEEEDEDDDDEEEEEGGGDEEMEEEADIQVVPWSTANEGAMMPPPPPPPAASSSSSSSSSSDESCYSSRRRRVRDADLPSSSQDDLSYRISPQRMYTVAPQRRSSADYGEVYSGTRHFPRPMVDRKSDTHSRGNRRAVDFTSTHLRSRPAV